MRRENKEFLRKHIGHFIVGGLDKKLKEAGRGLYCKSCAVEQSRG